MDYFGTLEFLLAALCPVPLLLRRGKQKGPSPRPHPKQTAKESGPLMDATMSSHLLILAGFEAMALASISAFCYHGTHSWARARAIPYRKNSETIVKCNCRCQETHRHQSLQFCDREEQKQTTCFIDATTVTTRCIVRISSVLSQRARLLFELHNSRHLVGSHVSPLRRS